jgi:KDO2-lipid IV(A) lauroyltransferase
MKENSISLKYFFYQGLGAALQTIGIRQAGLAGALLGEIMWTASPGRRKLAVRSISHHLGLDNMSATRIARQNFRHTGSSFIEMFLTRKVDLRFTAANISFVDASRFRHIKNIQRPIVAATGHFGSWELLSPLLAMHFSKRECQIIVKHPKDRAFAEIVAYYRGVGGNQIVSKDQAASRVLRCLSHNGISAFLVDHNAKRSKSIFLPFLGEQASVNLGPAVLAIRSRAIVWPIFLLRIGRGKYQVHSHEPLDCTQLSGKMQEKVKRVTEFYTQAVEQMVERYPEQWFWMHKRWRTRPLGEKHRPLASKKQIDLKQ